MNSEKQCTCCHRWKDREQFPVRSDRPTGDGRSSHCFDCKRASQRKTDRQAMPAMTLAEFNRQDLAATLAFALWFGPVSREAPLRWCA